jgi:hypothetical protein
VPSGVTADVAPSGCRVICQPQRWIAIRWWNRRRRQPDRLHIIRSRIRLYSITLTFSLHFWIRAHRNPRRKCGPDGVRSATAPTPGEPWPARPARRRTFHGYESISALFVRLIPAVGMKREPACGPGRLRRLPTEAGRRAPTRIGHYDHCRSDRSYLRRQHGSTQRRARD